MILSNYEEFMQFVPTTFDSNQDIELFREWVDIAEYTAGFNLFGTELYQAISALPDNDNFRVLCKRYICHSALYEAIPNLDLILTPNGFAVVGGSNSQFVPASKDRVAALRLQEDVWTEKFREMIIRRIAISPGLFKLWTKKEAFAGNLFVGYDDFRTYCAADDMRNPVVYSQAVTRFAKWSVSIIYLLLSRRQRTPVFVA